MKKYITILTLTLGIYGANAQMTMSQNNDILMFKKSPDFNDASTTGSKYINDKFEFAKVNQGDQNFLIRYNVYTDMMEYKNNGDILELIKDKNRHLVFNDGTIFELLKVGTNEHYHQILSNSANVKISKFNSVKLEAARTPANSYDTYQQANYKLNKPQYFITLNNETYEFEGKSKELEKLIPAKATEIKKYFKDNKVKENDTDMIKLGQFLSTL